ncbi:hypothetical protein BKA65DRAFT_576516 [Rhexocercosporidium sp. MPI-PUGE-AT-0058]|nr:hypothetical protein BKA65DRAFT_576516 [Rhexocercosporidium sp. MPI-PUGE-AT-0058]
MTAKVDEFVKNFTCYLAKHNLSEHFALKVVDPAKASRLVKCKAEVEVVDIGTVVLPKSIMVSKDSIVATGWPSPLQPTDSEGDDPPARTTYAKKVTGTHQVFTNDEVDTAEKLVDELVR